jgi:hypothetical protein
MTNSQVIAALETVGEIDSATAASLSSGGSLEYTPMSTAQRVTLVKSMNIITGYDSSRLTFDFANSILKVYHISNILTAAPAKGKTADGIKYYDSLDKDGDGVADTFYEYLRDGSGNVLFDSFFFDYIIDMA